VSGPELTDLWVVDPPAAWEAIGFTIQRGVLRVAPLIDIHPGADVPALAISGVEAGTLDGTSLHDEPAHLLYEGATHPNGVVGIDHFVIVTPDFDRTTSVLEQLDLPLRRIRDAGGFRQGFRRLGPAILELVEARQMSSGPARFWGVTFIAGDLDALADQLGPKRLRPIKEAVQPGRRIATLDRAAGLRTNVAFMDPGR
jgi:hypothetical protein